MSTMKIKKGDTVKIIAGADKNKEGKVLSVDVKNGKVFKMPSKAEAWDSPVPSGILGAVWLSTVHHPEICTETSVNDIIDTYYETFYDFKYSEK